MNINAGIHFTKHNIRIVFVNRHFEIMEALRGYNNSNGFYILKHHLLHKYPPGKIRFIIDEKHFCSQTFPKILRSYGYIFTFIPPAIYYDPVFNLFMAIPKKTHFHKPFIKAAMLLIPNWKSRFLKPKQRKSDHRQLNLF